MSGIFTPEMSVRIMRRLLAGETACSVAATFSLTAADIHACCRDAIERARRPVNKLPALRQCLRCPRLFNSAHAGNRVCYECTRVHEYAMDDTPHAARGVRVGSVA